MIKFTLNNQELEVPDGTTVLQAARANGITIPTLCDHPDLTPYGGCRLCVVEVEGARVPQAACTLPATNGMMVRTETPALTQSRKTVLELLLSNYYDSGYTPSKDPALNELAALGPALRRATAGSLKPKQPRYAVNSDPNPVRVGRSEQVHPVHALRARLRRSAGPLRVGPGRARLRRAHHGRARTRPCSTRAANRAARAWPTAPPARSTTRCRWTSASPIRK